MNVLTAPVSRQTRRRTRRHDEGPASGPQNLSPFFAQQRREMTQYFWVNPLQRTLIRTRQGTEFHLDPLTFADAFGSPVREKVQVEIIELNEKADIILADRPTTSGNQLLETGGAFFFRATWKDRDLRLARPVKARLPISNRVGTPGNMSIFSGQNRQGNFDWAPDAGRRANLEVNQLDKTFEITIEQPGWINCDHFYRLTQQQHYQLEVVTNQAPSEQEVFLIYRTINTVAKMQRHPEGYFYFPSAIPMPAIIYGISMNNGQFRQGFYLSDHDPLAADGWTQVKNRSLQLELQPVNQETIKQNLEAQIKAWDDQGAEKARVRMERTRRWISFWSQKPNSSGG